MKTQPFILLPEKYGPALDVLGTKVTVLASKTATHAYELTLQRGDEGTGPPPHRHDWDETFFVLKGQVEFSYDGETIMCGSGTLVHLPAGTLHGFCFGAGGGEMLELTGQNGHATQMFTAISDEMQSGPPDTARMLEVLNEYGVTVPV